MRQLLARVLAWIPRRGDGGSITPLVPIVMFGLLLLGGLVVDGSRELNARGDAQAYAEEAARAGATAIDPTNPKLVLLDSIAGARVGTYCQAVEHGTHAMVRVTTCALERFSGAKTCDGTDQNIVVHTKVTVQIDSTLLGMAGFSRFSASAVAAARPYEGVTSGSRC